MFELISSIAELHIKTIEMKRDEVIIQKYTYFTTIGQDLTDKLNKGNNKTYQTKTTNSIFTVLTTKEEFAKVI